MGSTRPRRRSLLLLAGVALSLLPTAVASTLGPVVVLAKAPKPGTPVQHAPHLAPLGPGAAGSSGEIYGVATPSDSVTVAVGTFTPGNGVTIGLIETRSGSQWISTAAPVPAGATQQSAAAKVLKVACPSTTVCMAVGWYTDNSGNRQGLLLNLSGSTWTATKAPLPNPAANPVAGISRIVCTSTASCVAVGDYNLLGGGAGGVIETYSSGSWSAVNAPVPSNAINVSGLSSISCPTTGACVAVGSYDLPGPVQTGLLEVLSGGSWTATQAPFPASSNYTYLNDVSCWSSTSCEAIGFYNDTTTSNIYGLIETLASGTWTGTQAPSPSNATTNPWEEMYSISCPSSGFCQASGTYETSSMAPGVILSLAGGSWSASEAPEPANIGPSGEVSVPFVTCTSSTSCVLADEYPITSSDSPGALDELSSGSWSSLEAPGTDGTGTYYLSIACSSVGNCVAGGASVEPSASGSSPFISIETGGSWGYLIAPGATLPPLGGNVTAAEAPTGQDSCWSCTANGSAQGTATSHPINTESGNFFHVFTDISIPGRSYPLAVTRTYNSQNASVNGPFGYGWNFNYGMSLTVSGTSPNEVATITQEDGSQVTFTQPSSGNVWSPTAPRTIATLTANTGGTWRFLRKAKDTYNFNSSGQLTSMVDLNGYTTTLSYTSGKLTTVTDPASRTLSIGWTGSLITSVADSNVSGNTRTVTYQYNDGNGNLTDVLDVNGGHTQFVYNTSHQMTTMYDSNCYAANQAHAGTCPGVINNYNTNGTVAWQKDDLGRETSFTYSGTPGSAAGGTTLTTDPSGNQTFEAYQYGIRTSLTHGYGTGAAATTYYAFDPATLTPIYTLDPNGSATTQTVDSSGSVLTSTDPLGHVTTKTYNSFNEPLTVQDGNGVTTTNTYDSNGNLTSTSTPVTGTTCTCEVVTYNHTDSSHPGDITNLVDGDGKTTYLGYDTNGNRVEVKDPLGNVSGSVYNADGWLTASYTPKAGCTWGSTPPTGCSSTYETQYSYIISGTTLDEFGDVQKVTDPLSHATAYTYDANRNLLTTTDGNGNSTTNAYDLANELCWTLPGATSSNTCASPPTNGRVTDYNLDGTVADQKDGKGNAILTYGYDSLGRVTSSTDALGNVTNYVRDGNGNVLNKIDPGGSCTGTVSKCMTNTYDADNELTTVAYSDNSSENITSATYDGDSQRTAMTDGTGSSSRVFDNLHRLTSYTNGNGAPVGYTYNLRNEPLTVVYPGTSHTATYTYDDAARMNSLTDWLSSTASTFGYDANSNLTADTLRNGVTDTYTPNAADQLTGTSDKHGTATIFAATYTRDSNGQVASDSSQASAQRNYKYTALNQLCYAGSANTNACTSPPTSSYPYSYDNADNLTYMENSMQSGKNTQAFNAADELCWTVSGVSSNTCSSAPTGATAFNYDTKGDRTSMVPTTGSAICDTYDQPNRLTQIQMGTGSTCTTPTTVGTYAYDGDGLRQSKSVSGTTTQYLWSGPGGNLLQEQAGSANPTLYIYGPGGLPVEQINNTTAYFFAHDQLGSTRALSSSTGAKKSTFDYDPYGNVVKCTAATVTEGGTNECSGTSIGVESLMYSGQYRDDESNLYYLRARYYDTTTATFLNSDPAVAATMAPYGYVKGNPLNETDRSGMISFAQMVRSSGISAATQMFRQIGQQCSSWLDPGLCMSAAMCGSAQECHDVAQGAADTYAELENGMAHPCQNGRVPFGNLLTFSLSQAQTLLTETKAAFIVSAGQIAWQNADASCRAYSAAAGAIAVGSLGAASIAVGGGIAVGGAIDIAEGIHLGGLAAAGGGVGTLGAGTLASQSCA
jgi:RHS repeat-associated protein